MEYKEFYARRITQIPGIGNFCEVQASDKYSTQQNTPKRLWMGFYS